MHSPANATNARPVITLIPAFSIRSTNQAVRGSNPLERANLFSESANSLSPRLSY